jgi:hypothetical protein
MENKGGYRSSIFLLLFWTLLRPVHCTVSHPTCPLTCTYSYHHSCLLSFLLFVEALPTMDNENEETKQDLPSDDSRTLVADLTRHLTLNEPFESSSEEPPHATADPRVQNEDNRQITSNFATNFSSSHNGGQHLVHPETRVVEAQGLDETRRAGDLSQQRHGLDGTTPLAPPPSDWARLRALHGLAPSPVANPLEPDLPFSLAAHDYDGGGAPLPGFLADSQVRMAMHRAAALQPRSQRLPHDASPTHLSPSFVERPRFHLERGIEGYQATNIPLANVLTHPHPSPPHLFPRETVSVHGVLPERFVPGKETESVLRLVKRPKLRPKDLSHRQSLVGEAPGSSTAEAAQSGSPVPYFTPGPSRHQPHNARPPTSEWERPFMITS